MLNIKSKSCVKRFQRKGRKGRKGSQRKTLKDF